MTPVVRPDADLYRDVMLPAYRENYGDPTADYHAHAYDAANLIMEAAERVAETSNETTFIPRTALRDELYELQGYDGATGQLSCGANGGCGAVPPMIVLRYANGRFRPIP